MSMMAGSETHGIAAVKWVAAAPVGLNDVRAGINGLICVSDYKTGEPIAVLDGNTITLIRTAALSAAAAVYLAPEAPTTIGFVGCGQQALSHLEAFVDLFPSLRKIHLLSRSLASAERVAVAASRKGLQPIIANDPEKLLNQSEIVVSMVPISPGLKPFLDARVLPSSSFVTAVDRGCSWLPETFTAFNTLVTHSLRQSTAPWDASGRAVESVKFHDDLEHLASGSSRPSAPMKAFFGFGGYAIADLALAELALRMARASGIGTHLPR
ncbi:ornithine cyclodeaminase family protein [Bradyrhizobium hereditatis]|uniref:ornithine cyclodeaminase family protein n=1 Tax=Bradyrhizobium hereditatis TaxID=2821405 RepID=UPI00201C775B|nr:ornithine cyclodeaminase family protein [Bradyrhizobium hereditatis]